MRSLATLSLVAAVVVGQDPADSWLAYAKAPGNGKRVTNVSVTWIVPALPEAGYSDAAPGFWYGLEPSPALDLIQPILALDDDRNGYSAFIGHFDWHDGSWDQTNSFPVNPGETLFSTTTYDQSSNSYNLFLQSMDHPSNQVSVNYPVNYGETYTDVYVVVEKQPPSCDQYPANGGVTFSNITIAWEGIVNHSPAWMAAQYQPACGSTAHIVNNSTINFTWRTSGPAAEAGSNDVAVPVKVAAKDAPRRFRNAAKKL